jgi:hypothetical protein
MNAFKRGAGGDSEAPRGERHHPEHDVRQQIVDGLIADKVEME